MQFRTTTIVLVVSIALMMFSISGTDAVCTCATSKVASKVHLCKVGAYCGTRTTKLYPNETTGRLSGDCKPRTVYQCYAANTEPLVKVEECPVPCQENNASPGLDICPFFRKHFENLI